MRKKKDPKVEFARFKFNLHQITQAINKISKSVLTGAMGCKLTPMTENEKFDALTAMFVSNNNQTKCDSDGTVNKKVIKCIVKRDPQLYDD